MSKSIQSKISLIDFFETIKSSWLIILLAALSICIHSLSRLADKATQGDELALAITLPLLILVAVFFHSILSKLPDKNKQAFDLNLIANIIFMFFTLDIFACVVNISLLTLRPLWLMLDPNIWLLIRVLIVLASSILLILAQLKHNNYKSKFQTRNDKFDHKPKGKQTIENPLLNRRFYR